jgi:hypothetical protein
MMARLTLPCTVHRTGEGVGIVTEAEEPMAFCGGELNGGAVNHGINTSDGSPAMTISSALQSEVQYSTTTRTRCMMFVIDFFISS